MNDLKYLYNDEFLKLVIEQDIVGFYLIVYNNPNSEKSSEDYLFDSLEEVFQAAQEKFHISPTQWKKK